MVVVDNAAADDDHWEIPSSFAKLKLLTAQIDLRQSIKRTLKLDAGNTLTFKQLYQYAPRRAVYFSVLGLVAALLNSTLMPVMFMIYGGTTDLFISRVICKALEIYDILDICPVGVNDLNFHLHYKRCNLSLPGIPELPDHDLVEGVSRNSVYFTLIGIGTFIFAGIQIAAFSFACELTVAEVRKRLVRSIFELPVEWFDQNDAGVVSSLLIENVNKLKNGLGDKIGLIVQAVGTSLVAAIIGFARSWKLSLVMMAASPPLILASALATIVTVRSTNAEIKAYARAGAVAQQSIRNIRTVQAFGGQRKMIDQYQSHLGQAKKEGIKKSTINGLMLSTLWFTIFATYALGFWYGSRLEDAGEISVGDLLTVFLGIQTAIFTLGNALPHVTSANEARAAGFDLYRLIDEPGETSPAQKAHDFSGKDIVFENVSFRYPTRPEVKVLDDFCLTIPAGKTTAFVGESGCGKSTLVQLLLRYYTPQSGKILIGGKDIQSFDLCSYRSRLGLVSQEPVLFSSSIEENIRLGKMLCSRDEIEQVCRISNAHEFISDLPAGYETNVGESGSSLSGGQKQRIAIARALVGDPSVLLLDEATSALDSESERHVQKTLEQASQGRTTLIIAHRLSTIRNADLIVGLSKGKIVEMGTHDQLMALEGIYSGLVNANEKQDDSDFDWSAKQIESRQRARSLRALTSISRKSSTSRQQELTTESIVPSEKAKNVTRFMFSMNRPELIYILVGCVSCAGFGLMQTLFELYFARIVVAFGICFKDTRVNEINSNCIIFVVFAVMSMIAQIVSSFSFAISGENLTKRLRTAIFELLMRYDIGFFDDPNNSVGSLCTMLASEASAVHGATGIRVGVVLANFFILGTGAILALVYGWMLALVIAAFIPLIIVSGLLSIRLSGKFDSYEKKFLEQAGRIAVEATSNIRTVKQLNTQQFFADKYVQIMDEAFRKNAKKCILTGLLFGFSQGVIFFTLATGYYAGSHFVAREMMNIEELMIVFAGMLFASMAVGQNQAMAPEHGKSRAAAVKIYDILHDQPEMDSMSHTGNIPATFQGKYEFRNVDFSYPSRDSVQVLRKFNWTVEKGTDVALVGPSGCGKSTIIQLMERYYEPTNGEIILDGQNLKNVNIGWYRKQLGLVGQEPVLFDWSIAENIRFGDTSRADIAIDEIRFVANIANVDDFICKLPNGYDTRVGSKGALMSGGQKQRICIARSLIRDPKLLMLDEATSALDAESEKLVQEAIEDAQKQRGSVTIAHKLKTIENSDEICVLSRGKVVEQGKHEELLKMDGLYTDLYKLSAR